MEAIDDRFAAGYGSPGLATVLSRMGVRFLLVRNDIQRDAGRGTGTWPARVHEALFRTPGVHKVAEFGGFWGQQFNVDATVSYDQPYKALEIYEVPQAEPLVNAVPSRRPLRVTGGPEALLTLADAGLLDDDRPVLFNDDGGATDIPGADTVVTDTLRRREVNFADVRKGSSPTLTETDRYKGSARVKDLIDPGWSRYETLARLYGVRSVTASSSAADITSLPQLRSAGQQPYAAIDGDAHTTWTSAGWFGAVDEWLDVRFRGQVRLSQLNVAFAVNELLGPPVSEVSIETAAGRIKQPVKATGAVQTLNTPNGSTDHVRIRVTKLAYPPKRKFGSRVGISELSVRGLWPARAIVAPKVESPGRPASGADGQTIALTGLTGSSPPCMLGSRSWVCNPLLEVQGEDGGTFDRVFTPSASGEYRITGTALLTSLRTIEQYTTLRPPKVSASTASVEHPANMGRSAFDGDRATTWISNPLDQQPALTVDFGRQVTVSRLKFIFTNEITQRPMTQVGVAGGAAPGTGPTFQVAGTGQRVVTRLVGGTLADLAQGHPVPYESCGRLPLLAGEQRLYVGAGDPFRIASAIVRPVDTLRAPAVQDQPMEVNSWTPEHRSVSVSTTSESYLVVNDNYNAGWRATIGGEQLRSVRLDGWRQAWVLPRNTEGTVEMTYAPDRWYRGGLLAGFLLILSLALLAWVPARRDELVRAPVLRPARLGPRWAWVLAPLLGFWAGGLYGLAATTAMVGLLVAVRRYEGRSSLPARLAAGVRSPFVAGGPPPPPPPAPGPPPRPP